MGLFSSPAVPSINGTYGQMLKAQQKYAPLMLSLNQQYSPQYQQLQLDNLSKFLPQYLAQYQNTIMPALTNAQLTQDTALRTGAVNDATALAPSLTALARGANPGAAGLLDKLTASTNNELNYGTELTPAEKVQLRQSVRGGQAARGMGYSPGDVFDESMAETGMGQNLLQQRTTNAQNLVPTLTGFYTNPLTLTGINGGGGLTAAGVTSTGSSFGPAMLSEFNPINQMSLTHMQQEYDSNVASANNSNALLGGLMKTGMGVGAGLMTFGAGGGFA